MFAAKLKLVAAVFLTATLAGFGLLLQSGITASADQPGDEPASSGIRETADAQPGARSHDSAVMAHKRQSQNNLKQLVLAMHNYMDTYGHFPPPAIYAGGSMVPGAKMPGGPPGAMGPAGMGAMPGQGRPGTLPRMPGRPARSRKSGVPGTPGGSGDAPGSGGGSPRGAGLPGGGPAAPGAPGLPGGSSPPGSNKTPDGSRGTSGFGPPGGVPQAPGSAPPGAGGPAGFSGLPPAGGAGGAPSMPGAGVPGPGTMMAGASHTGRALLSWRVAILPFLGENELYRQFRLNESWDSPHNLKLLKRMPRVFAPPGVKTAKPYTTFYQVFVGPHAGFEKHRSLPISTFLDGTSNTILIIEAGTAVPWTKPADLSYAADEPLPDLGGMFTDVMHAAFADGAIHNLPKNCDQEMLRLAIMRDDGYPFDLGRLERPVKITAADLKAEEKELTEALRQERERLVRLRRELDELKKADAAGTKALREENDRLRGLLERTRREAETLHAEIQRMRRLK